MKVHIIDKETLSSLSPIDLVSYLQGKGAQKIDEYQQQASVWLYGDEELIIPQATYFADYALRIAQVLHQIETVEQRSQLMIVSDIHNSGYDIIRLHCVSPDARKGTISFVKGVEFVRLAREMLAAAAYSAATHRVSYTGKKPRDAELFMEAVRFGQTEGGSFVLQVLSPVTKELFVQGGTAGSPIAEMDEQPPYQHTVVPTLQSGLEALTTVAQSVNEAGNTDSFTKAAAQGLTTNLCDAFVGMCEALDPQYLDVDITFSRNRRETRPFVRVNVDAGYAPIIRAASGAVKKSEPAAEPEAEQLVRGLVVKLASEDPVMSGSIIIKDIMPQKTRYLAADLEPADYAQAVAAHGNKQLVELSGLVFGRGKTLRLVPMSPLMLVPFE